MTATFGGKGRTVRPRNMRLIGAEMNGRPIQKRKRRTRTAASPRPCATIRCSIPTSNAAKASRSARSFSADAAAIRCRLFFKRSIGSTVFISARPWLRRQRRTRPGGVGKVPGDPMAMLPFCGYNIGDYFRHWLDTGKRLTNPPLIFNVNWFRKSEDGKFLWPGFGDNMRVLKWIVDRCEGSGAAVKSPIGWLPGIHDLDLAELELDHKSVAELLGIDHEEWKEELEEHKKFFESLGGVVPEELEKQRQQLAERFA